MNKALPLILSLFLLPAWSVVGQQRSDEYRNPPSGEAQRWGQTRAPLTNVSIVELVKAGMSEETILNVINTQPGQYILDPDYLYVLKRAGVSEKVIAAMRACSAAGPAPTPSVPETSGLYYMTAGELHAIVGQAVVFRRTGSLLVSALTMRIVSGKVNIKVPGERSGTHLSSRPVFFYRTSPDDPPGVLRLVLTRLKVSGGKRQLEAQAVGAWRASKGISINAQIQINISQAAMGMYRVVPTPDLTAGEYAFYQRTAGASTQDAFLYDFLVE